MNRLLFVGVCRCAAGFASLLLFPLTSCADVLVRYLIASENGSSDLDPSFVHAGLSAGPITRAGGLQPNTDLAIGGVNFGFVSVEWPEDAFGQQRMEITITPAPGQAIDFNLMTYAFGGFPKMTYRVATSLDNFVSSIVGPFSNIPVGDTREASDSLTALPLVTSPVTFRWYAFSDSSVEPESGLPYAGFFDQDTPFPIVFEGTVIPEPSPVALLSGALLAFSIVRRRPVY